jgi:hypothetical protein
VLIIARIRNEIKAKIRIGKARACQVTVRYYDLYANAHRGKVRKANRRP